MKTENVQSFMEKYDAEMMYYVNNFASERGVQLTGLSFKGINVDESFNEFTSFLKEYCTNLSKNGVPKNFTIDAVKENFNKATEHSFAEKVNVKYMDMPSIITSYLEHTTNIEKDLSHAKYVLMEHSIAPEYVGILDDLWECYNEKLSKNFYEMVDHTIACSGYHTNKQLFGKKSSSNENVVFV